MSHKQRPCPCGSGLQSSWQHDARGIPMCRTCVRCHTAKMDGYRADVINNPNYDADEPIDDDPPSFHQESFDDY